MIRWLSFAQWACLVLLLAGAANMSGLAAGDAGGVAQPAAVRDVTGQSAGLEPRRSEEAEVAPPARRVDRRRRKASPAASPCPAAQKAVGYYRRKYTASRSSMGLEGAPPRVWYRCASARRRAAEWRDRAAVARDRYTDWKTYQYAWWEWMPRGWQNIGACETGYGRRPGNFQHNSGAYQGAFGFAVSSWDGFVGAADPKAGPYPSEAYLATPRQQYEVALAIYRRFGLSGWGCRGAFYRG